MKYNIEERQKIHKMMQTYGTDPFTGRCYVEELDVKYNRQNKTYDVSIPEDLFEKHIWLEDFLDKDMPNNHRFSNISHIYMIKPIDEENYIVFRRV